MHENDNFTIKTELLICLFLVISTFAVYWQVRHHEFVAFDDDDYIINNPRVRAGLTPESITWAFTSAYASNWHPLTWLSHMTDIQLYGINPGQHHLTNVLLHIMNSLLLFFVLRRMTGDLWKSGFAAALFALHPLHAESVAWVSERKDLLSTFFWMLTLWSYIRYVESPGMNTGLPVLVCFTLGLMSKPMLVTLPFVLLLLDYWPLNRLSAPCSLLLEKIPLFVLSAVSSVITFIVQQGGGAVKSPEIYPFDLRIANALVSYMNYILKTVWPSELAFLYPYPRTIPGWQIALATLLLILISLLAIRQIKQRPYLIVGWLWYLGTLVPVIGLVQVGLQSMADRYTYIPLIGIFIMIAWGIPELFSERRHRKTIFAVAAAAIFSVLMVKTYLQIGYWRNSTALFEHALAVTTGNYMAHNKLAEVLLEKGRHDQAVAHYTEAIRLNPRFAKAYNNMAIALEEQGKTDEAIRYYSQALRINPGLAKTHNNLGYAFEKQGRTDEAMKHYTKALELNPEYAEVRINLAVIFLSKKRIDDAILHLQAALRVMPDNVEALNNLGVALAYKGKNEEAVIYLRKALQIKPGHAGASGNLKKVLSWLPGKDAEESHEQ
ncbi:tetratricopeptide repeat protein [Desulfococcaceae bacterium HSG8]|nr:tetratricopeptide repeat protein [Desulfococcaceae bacterium HSG8]